MPPSTDAAATPRVAQRVALVEHGRVELLGDALERLAGTAESAGVEVVRDPDAFDVDLVVALGGDGTMLRALHRFLGTRVPVIGVNFGRIGFLTSIPADELEAGLRRAFAGDYKVVELATISAAVDGRPHDAVNDVVATSSVPGRMIELAATLGGESLGVTACDGMICTTPSGSTAYNLSNGGPVIMRGLDAMAMTYVAPHALHSRPLVVPPGLGLEVENRTPDVPVTVLVDGQRVGELAPSQALAVDVGSVKALLALLPEVTFFSRYRDVFLDPR
jgi:NAD+ kinase